MNGLPGIDGAPRGDGERGDTNTGILTRNGGSGSVAQGGTLVFAHGLDLSAGEVRGTTTVTFNVIRMGNTTGDLTVEWAVRGGAGSAASGADFAGGRFPGGTVTLESSVPGVIFNSNSVETVSFDIASDSLSEGRESFRIVLSDPSGGAGRVILGTSGEENSERSQARVRLGLR